MAGSGLGRWGGLPFGLRQCGPRFKGVQALAKQGLHEREYDGNVGCDSLQHILLSSTPTRFGKLVSRARTLGVYEGESRTILAQKTPPALGMYSGGRFLVICCTGVTRE